MGRLAACCNKFASEFLSVAYTGLMKNWSVIGLLGLAVPIFGQTAVPT